MIRTFTLFASLLTSLSWIALATSTQAQAVEWNVDQAHSRVAFTAKHLGFSKVEGHFEKFAATIKADAKSAKIEALEATAEAASVNTGIEKRDAHLRADDFFDATKHPQLKLVLKSIKWNGKTFTAKVDLTIRDITKEVTFKGELLGVQTVNFGQGAHPRAGYEATARINRKDFGLKYNGVTEGLAIVGDEIEIELTLEMSHTPKA
jgi:polyisoprenoid-binding protein YceI